MTDVKKMSFAEILPGLLKGDEYLIYDRGDCSLRCQGEFLFMCDHSKDEIISAVFPTCYLKNNEYVKVGECSPAMKDDVPDGTQMDFNEAMRYMADHPGTECTCDSVLDYVYCMVHNRYSGEIFLTYSGERLGNLAMVTKSMMESRWRKLKEGKDIDRR